MSDPQEQRTRVQRRVFTSFLNSLLSNESMEISSADQLLDELHDGSRLLITLEQLVARHWNKQVNLTQDESSRHPKNVYQKMDNVRRVIDYLQQNEKIDTLVNINAKDIVDAKEKIILGLVWRIIHHYQVSRTAQKELAKEREQKMRARDQQIDEKHLEAQRELSQLESKLSDVLKWVNLLLEENDYQDPDTQDAVEAPKDFENSWKDGRLLRAVVICLTSPDQREDAISQLSESDMIQQSLDYAHEKFGIPKLLTPEDFETPDKLSMMTYVSYFRDYYLEEKKRSILETVPEFDSDKFDELPSNEDETKDEAEDETFEEEESPNDQEDEVEEDEVKSPSPQHTSPKHNPYENNNNVEEDDDGLTPMMKQQISRQNRIAEQREQAREKREAEKQSAQEYKEKFSKEKSDAKEKKQKLNRDEERNFMDTLESDVDNVWEKVALYCNFNAPSGGAPRDQDTKRMRRLLLELKNEGK